MQAASHASAPDASKAASQTSVALVMLQPMSISRRASRVAAVGEAVGAEEKGEVDGAFVGALVGEELAG